MKSKSDLVLIFIGYLAIILGCSRGEERTLRGERLQPVQADRLSGDFYRDRFIGGLEGKLLIVHNGRVSSVNESSGEIIVSSDMSSYNFTLDGSERVPDPLSMTCKYVDSEKPKLSRLHSKKLITIIGRLRERFGSGRRVVIEDCEIEF